MPLTTHADTPQVVLRADFETADALQIATPESTAKLTKVAAEVVAGTQSLKGDSRDADKEWNEFFRTKPGHFKSGEAYTVSFDYKVLARAEKAQFYCLLRRGTEAGNVGWKSWQGAPGETGHIETSFAPRASGFTFILGIQNKGAIAIDNLVIQTDPANRPISARWPEIKRTWKSPGQTAYYVDSQDGDDANLGTSEKAAWKTPGKINSGEFAPGDKILLRAGSAWRGFLAPGGSGTPAAPIVLGRYGDGAKPKIDGEGQWMAALYLLNVQGFEVSDLDIANKGAGAAPGLCGVLAKLDNFGTAKHIHLKNLDVHDVTGSNVKSDGGGNGIHFTSGGAQTKSRFDDLLIENCRLTRTDRNGITGSGYWARKDWFPHLNVVIRGNLLEDIGGDGIVPIACDGALVERNIIRGGRMRAADHAAGIWPWSCDNTIIQFNEVSGYKGTQDGQGFDSDWNCRNTLIQYNYSHDNEGGFLLICNDGTSKMPWNIGNIGTVVRYNISQNDGTRTFHITGPCRDTQIYNNTIFIGPKLNINLVLAGDWGGDWAENTRFANNIFSVEGKAKFDFGGMRKTVFENNIFHGNIENRPADAKAISADPKLTAPGTAGYKLAPDSPAKGTGVVVENSGGRDFFGNKIPAEKPDVGAG